MVIPAVAAIALVGAVLSRVQLPPARPQHAPQAAMLAGVEAHRVLYPGLCAWLRRS